jgi:type II secretory pathway pseudopilin PulG
MKKEKNGITLIALVVTIVVLLILAGTSIAMLTGDNGIISQAKNAKDKTNEANAKEQIDVEVAGSYGTDGKINITQLNENLGHIDGLTHEGQLLTDNPITSFPVTVELNGLGVTINSDGSTIINVAESGNIDTTPVIIEKIEIPNEMANNEYNCPMNVTISNVTNEDYPITVEYYKKLASEADSTYEKLATNTLTEGTTDRYLYSGLSWDSSYMLKVRITDKSGNSVTAEKTAGTNCFLAGTQVLSEDGMKNIENIKVGDRVYAINIDNNAKELKEVTSLFNGKTDEVYEITIGDELVRTTPKHQFYIVDKGWTRAYELKEGDKISSKDNDGLIIKKIEHKFYKDPIPVYNLTVDGYHNYLITKYELLVHNRGSIMWEIK